MTRLTIRPCQPQDFQAIADIYNESIAEGRSTMDIHPVDSEKFRKTYEGMGDREVLLVAETDRVIGWGAVKKYSDRVGYRVCCETSIYLTLSETGNGYGTQLQQALLERVIDYRYHHVLVRIMAANRESIQFHRKFGFEIVGIHQEIGYFNNRWHDVAFMQLILPEVLPFLPEDPVG